jgi:uncharacterized membrane protein SpoIIM required for sporulation
VANLDQFISDRSATWNELDRLLNAAGGSPSRLGADGVRRLGASYRATSADLALARRRFPADPIVARLEGLTRRGRVAVYHSRPGSQTVREFVSHGYWRRIRERPGLLWCSLLLTAVPTVLAGYWAWRDPGPASGLAPSQYQTVTQPRKTTNLHESADQSSGIAAEIFTNNIRVTFLAFAGGIPVGVITILVLLYNGLLLGVVGGLSIGAGNGRAFFELVLAHGVLELSCIIVSGAAGLRIAMSIIDPGNRPRGEAFRAEARAAGEMVLGTMPWLVVAGLVEGFLTPAGKGLTTVLIVGFGLGILYWGLVFTRGAPPRVTDAPAL